MRNKIIFFVFILTILVKSSFADDTFNGESIANDKSDTTVLTYEIADNSLQLKSDDDSEEPNLREISSETTEDPLQVVPLGDDSDVETDSGEELSIFSSDSE